MRAILLFLSLLIAAGFAPAQAQQPPVLPGLTEGVDYQRIDGGVPYRAVPGKIEVAEVFAYWCSHCAHFAPLFEAWKQDQPKNVQAVYVPSAFNKSDDYARFYFAADAARAVPVLHARLFTAIHETGELAPAAKLPQIAAFGARVKGVNATALAKALKDSKTLDAKMQYAYDFAVRSKVPGTPSLVIDGRYLVLGNSYEALLANASRVLKALPKTTAKPVKPAAKQAAR